MSYGPPRLSTGLERLDNALDGGVPAGSLILVTAAPASHGELLPYSMTAADPTRYLTVRRSAETVGRAIDSAPVLGGDPVIEGVDPDPEHLLTAVNNDGAPNTVVEPIDAFEERVTDGDVTRAQYWNQLDRLGEATASSDGLTVLYGLEGRAIPAARDITEHAADVVFQYEVGRSSDGGGPMIHVPKIRGGPGLEEPLKVTYEDGFGIDTTRGVS